MKPNLSISRQQAIDLEVCTVDDFWIEGEALTQEEFSEKKNLVIKTDLFINQKHMSSDPALSERVIYGPPPNRIPDGITIWGNVELRSYGASSLPHMRIHGKLSISDCRNLTDIRNVTVGGGVFILGDNGLGSPKTPITKLPDPLVCAALYIYGCPIKELPKTLLIREELRCNDIEIVNLPSLEDVGSNIALIDCKKLKSLPVNTHVNGNLELRGCTSLETLPRGMIVKGNLDLRGCTSLKSLPSDLKVMGKILRTQSFLGDPD